MNKIGSLDPEILAKKWSTSGQIEVSERFFEKISRNITDTEKTMMTNIIGNFVADNIVFGMEVLVYQPEELSLELLTFIEFLELSSGFDT